MADSRRARRTEYAAVPSTRERSGSEAIRKRVDQLMQDSGVAPAVEAPVITNSPKDKMRRRNSISPHSTRHSSRERRHKPEMTEGPSLTENGSRPIKRMKSSGKTTSSDKPENRIPATGSGTTAVASASSSHQSVPRVFGALRRSVTLEHDSTPSSQRKGRSFSTRTTSQFHTGTRQQDNDHNQDAGTKYTDNTNDKVLKGPLASAEYERMKKEVESLKEALHDARKVSKKNTKKLEETKAELTTAVLAMKEKESELSTVKTKYMKNEELLSTIESSIQCQICMDLPDNPFALSPCGHVLCLLCLQEWFKKAPPTLDDMDIDPDELTDPHYILMRTKSCPSCRAVVKRKPVPVFMIKAVASALKKSKPGLPNHFSAPREDDGDVDKDNPWRGIFPSSEEDSTDEESGESGDGFGHESSDNDEERQVMHALYHQGFRLGRRGSVFASSDSELGDEESDEDEDASEEGDDPQHFYVFPQWAPPSVEINPNDYTMPEGEAPLLTKLLQRGCSWEMIQNYDISYSHDTGIIVSLRSLDQLEASDDDNHGDITDGMNRVFIGWNIALKDDDGDGEVFMNEILQDIKLTPARWHLSPRHGIIGAMDAKKLVPSDEVEDYDTTDTEVWIDAEDF